MLAVSRQDDPSWAESDNLTVTINQRRRLLQRVAATLAVGGLSPQKALAATASSAPSGQVVTAKNKRIGGLVNKIRNVGGVMVGNEHLLWLGIFENEDRLLGSIESVLSRTRSLQH
jgi:hypothetical protein